MAVNTIDKLQFLSFITFDIHCYILVLDQAICTRHQTATAYTT